MSAKVYNSDQVLLVFAGIPILSGKGTDEFCSIAPVSDTYEDEAGADGEVIRTATNDKRHTVTITLMQTSVANSLLAAIHAVDKASQNGGGVGPLSLTDLNGTSIFVAGKAWIKRGPDLTFGKTVKERVWVIMAVEDAKFEGGQV